MADARWVHIGSWPDSHTEPGLDRKVLHLWTGVYGAACGAEDYGRRAMPVALARRCRTCLAQRDEPPIGTRVDAGYETWERQPGQSSPRRWACMTQPIPWKSWAELKPHLNTSG